VGLDHELARKLVGVALNARRFRSEIDYEHDFDVASVRGRREQQRFTNQRIDVLAVGTQTQELPIGAVHRGDPTRESCARSRRAALHLVNESIASVKRSSARKAPRVEVGGTRHFGLIVQDQARHLRSAAQEAVRHDARKAQLLPTCVA
jgi:hypothetical protein